MSLTGEAQVVDVASLDSIFSCLWIWPSAFAMLGITLLGFSPAEIAELRASGAV